MPNTPNTPYPNPQSRQSSATASRGPRTRPGPGTRRGPGGWHAAQPAPAVAVAPRRSAMRGARSCSRPRRGRGRTVASRRGLAPRPGVSRARGPPRCFSCNIVFFYYLLERSKTVQACVCSHGPCRFVTIDAFKFTRPAQRALTRTSHLLLYHQPPILPCHGQPSMCAPRRGPLRERSLMEEPRRVVGRRSLVVDNLGAVGRVEKEKVLVRGDRP